VTFLCNFISQKFLRKWEIIGTFESNPSTSYTIGKLTLLCDESRRKKLNDYNQNVIAKVKSLRESSAKVMAKAKQEYNPFATIFLTPLKCVSIV